MNVQLNSLSSTTDMRVPIAGLFETKIYIFTRYLWQTIKKSKTKLLTSHAIAIGGRRDVDGVDLVSEWRHLQ